MAEVKIKIATEIGESLNALNKETRSVKTLGDTLVHTKKNTEEFTAAQNAFFKAVNRDLQKAFDASNGGLKGYEAELKVLEKYETNLRLGVGKTSATYQKYSAVINHVKGEIGKIKKENLEAQKAQDAHNQSVRNFAEYLQRVEQQAASIRALNNQNADIGFMMLTGDELGVANYTLKQYEASLKETIAATGVNSQATQEAYAKYAQQKQIVDELAQSQERYASVQKTTAEETSTSTKAFREMEEATGKTGLKILSVAKNILKFQLLMGPITAVVRGFRNTLSDSVKVAAEAEQVFNKLTTVFDGFGDSAKKMASSLASSIGVANSTAASALSTVGDLLQAQGMGTSQSLTTAAEWVKQFQDIIAFKDINMTLEEFAQNFMSGAAGNLRNFRTFGSIVKESAVNAELAKKGLDKLTGSQLELAKMTTRAEMALEQQKNAMGATTREWDTMLSVNRRLSEAQKEWKENFGEGLNTMLKPAKTWWTELLESINKTNKAISEFADKTKEIGAFDIHNNKSDASKFKGAMRSILPGIMSAGYSLEAYASNPEAYGNTDYANNPVVREVEAQMRFFSASVEDVREIFGNQLSNGIYEYLKEQEKQTKAIQEEVKAREKALASFSSAASSYGSFSEAIRSLVGAKGIGTMDFSNAFDLGYTESDIQNFMGMDISSALASIKNIALETYGDVISGALDELNTAELLDKKMADLRTLFEISWNALMKGEITEEQARLEEIKKAYQEAKEASEAYQKRIEAEAGIKSLIGNAQDVLWEASTRQRLTGEGVPSDQMSIWIKYEKQLEELREKFGKVAEQTKKSLDEVTIEAEGQLYTLKNAEDIVIKARQEEIDAMKKEEEEVTKLSEIIAQGIFGENASAGYAQKFSSAVANSTGGQVVQAGMDGGVVGILVEILTQTETFTETLKSFDPIITTFSEFIKPILPAVQLIFNVINELVFSILKPFFPIIKGIAMVVASLAYPIKIVTNVIKNIYTAVHNILERITHPISGGDRWNYVSLADGVDEITGIIRDIKNMTFDIKQNTDPDNSELLKAYTQMRDKGMITGTEWEALVSGLSGVSYDRMRTYGSNAWQNGKGGTTIIYYGDLKFTIDGTNLSAEEIAEAVTRKQKEWAGNGQYA